jgi:hypothetical protein
MVIFPQFGTIVLVTVGVLLEVAVMLGVREAVDVLDGVNVIDAVCVKVSDAVLVIVGVSDGV